MTAQPPAESAPPSRTPRLVRIVQLAQARRDLPSRTLFHAGPPLRGEVPGAVLAAAAQAAVIEGWATDIDDARAQLGARRIALRPAQDLGLAAPLAMVIAPSMWCFEVGDGKSVAHAAMGEGPVPALRFGASDPACIARAREGCAAIAAAMNPLLSQLPPVEELIKAAHERGDDCHAITAAGTELIVGGLAGLDAEVAAQVRTNPGFALGVWMAWAAWKVRAVGSPIEAIGGNGLEFGLRMRGENEWRAGPATPPEGKFFNADRAAYALGAIGDSALVDICGLGGQALRFAPALVAEWSSALPGDWSTRRERVLDPRTGVVDPGLVLRNNCEPLVNLAILDKEGAAAPIGRGVYRVPLNLFH